MAYATDADLLARVPDASDIDSAVRAAALLDARSMLDDRSYVDRAVFAHCMLTAHLLALRTGELGGESGPVVSKAAGAVSVSWAAPGLDAGELLASTKWGRLFLQIEATVQHSPEVW